MKKKIRGSRQLNRRRRADSLQKSTERRKERQRQMAGVTGLLRTSFHPIPSSFPLPPPTTRPYLLRPRPLPNLSRTKPLPSPARASITPASDRLISAASYSLPLFNSLQYGRFVFLAYPRLSLLLEPLLPIVSLYRSLPYASFVAFFALYLGVVRNPSFSHYVRFNAMQAVTLDVLLVLPLLLQRILSPGRAGVGFQLMAWGHNVVFVFSALCFVYSLGCCVLGRTPFLPFVADAAGRQL